jgi:hypothetical protein
MTFERSAMGAVSSRAAVPERQASAYFTCLRR